MSYRPFKASDKPLTLIILCHLTVYHRLSFADDLLINRLIDVFNGRALSFGLILTVETYLPVKIGLLIVP